MDTSLQGVGIILFQRDEHGRSRVIAYASYSLHPNECLMCNQRSAKLELSVVEKLQDYLLGSKFPVYNNNNLLGYVWGSKLETAQIRWLSELSLFSLDLNIG